MAVDLKSGYPSRSEARIEPGEYIVVSFWRNGKGEEIMHAVGGFGCGETAKTKAIFARLGILQVHRIKYPTGPLPVVQVVKVKVPNER